MNVIALKYFLLWSIFYFFMTLNYDSRRRKHKHMSNNPWTLSWFFWANGIIWCSVVKSLCPPIDHEQIIDLIISQGKNCRRLLYQVWWFEMSLRVKSWSVKPKWMLPRLMTSMMQVTLTHVLSFLVILRNVNHCQSYQISSCLYRKKFNAVTSTVMRAVFAIIFILLQGGHGQNEKVNIQYLNSGIKYKLC